MARANVERSGKPLGKSLTDGMRTLVATDVPPLHNTIEMATRADVRRIALALPEVETEALIREGEDRYSSSHLAQRPQRRLDVLGHVHDARRDARVRHLVRRARRPDAPSR